MNFVLNRRLVSGWNVFRKHAKDLKGNLPFSLKRGIFNECILPVMTYGCET